MSPPTAPSRILPATLLAVLVAAGSCVDAPYAPEDGFVPGPLVLAPSLSWVGPDGTPAATQAQQDALAEAFDLVDRFHMVVRRASNDALALDTIITVEPGQDAYELTVSVTITSPGEQFLVTLAALQGDTELFTAPPIVVTATPEGTSAGSSPEPVEVTLTYSGPGVDAASIEVEPAAVVVGPGGTAALMATVRDQDGAPLGGVPLSWTTGSATVATVADGEVTGQSDGLTSVLVATPTGLEATALAYVVDGTLAYVQDGGLRVRLAAGGESEERSPANGAGAPAWSPDGERLYYAAEGAVRLAGADEPVVAGTWPALSPNGAYLAVDRGEHVAFANADGSSERDGPPGTTPVWLDDETLVVAGGSIERVDVGGEDRETVVAGDAILPALGPGGEVAYLDGGGALMVSGGAEPLAEGASGRPAWSASGRWIAFGGSGGLFVVPADGSAPPVPLPGLETAADPAWRPSTPLTPHPVPSLTGFSPDPPLPGRPVDLLGSGFDRVIPENNRVFWPTASGTDESEVLGVTTDRLATVMPYRVVGGHVRVESLGGSAVLPFVPSFGALEVSARTPGGAGVAGVLVVLYGPTEVEAARGQTDAGGSLLLSGLTPGAYGVQVTPPEGFSLLTTPPGQLDIGTEIVAMDLELTPRAQRIEVEPEAPKVSVGESLEVRIRAFDVGGNQIETFPSVAWEAVTHHLAVEGSGLSAVITGVAPVAGTGEARLVVTLGQDAFTVSATVTSHIAGRVTEEGQNGAQGIPGHAVVLRRGVEQIAEALTDAEGYYRFEGLLAGLYTVQPAAPVEGRFSPPSTGITLDGGTPTGQADFALSLRPTGAGEVIVLGDINFWGSGSAVYQANNLEMTRNFVTNGSRNRTVWYQGHDAYNPGTYSAAGYFGQARDYITNTLGQTLTSVTTGTTGSLSVPDDVASIWLWMPQAVFDAADVAELRRYVEAGGRVILIGENYVGVFDQTNQRVQELMNAFGSAGVYVDDCLSGVTSEITADPLMRDVASVQAGCSSHFTPGEGDEPLVRVNGLAIVMRLRLGAPVAPTPAPAAAPGPATLAPTSRAPVSGDPALGGVRAGRPGGETRH